jgi:hypothetical protein
MTIPRRARFGGSDFFNLKQEVLGSGKQIEMLPLFLKGGQGRFQREW